MKKIYFTLLTGFMLVSSFPSFASLIKESKESEETTSASHHHFSSVPQEIYLKDDPETSSHEVRYVLSGQKLTKYGNGETIENPCVSLYPTSMMVTHQYVFVTDGEQPVIAVLNPHTLAQVHEISLPSNNTNPLTPSYWLDSIKLYTGHDLEHATALKAETETNILKVTTSLGKTLNYNLTTFAFIK